MPIALSTLQEETATRLESCDGVLVSRGVTKSHHIPNKLFLRPALTTAGKQHFFGSGIMYEGLFVEVDDELEALMPRKVGETFQYEGKDYLAIEVHQQEIVAIPADAVN